MIARRRVAVASVCLVLVAAVSVYLWSRQRSSPSKEDQWKQAHLEKGRELLKSAPKAGTAEWFKWYESLSQDDALSWSLAADEAAKPPEATEAQRSAAVVTAAPPSSSGLFKGRMLQNYKPLLRMEERVSIRPLQLDTVRGPNGLETTMWARRAASAIKVEWAQGRVSNVKVDNIERADGPIPQWVEEDMLFSAGVNGLWHSDNATGSGFRIPWPRKSYVRAFVVSRNFPYLLGNESPTFDDRMTGIVVIDKKRKVLADVIPVPPGTENVYCVLDMSKQYLAVLDSGWQWIMMFDLATLAGQGSQSDGAPHPVGTLDNSKKGTR